MTIIRCRMCECVIDDLSTASSFDADDNTAIHATGTECLAALKRSRDYAWNRPFDLAPQEENARLKRENTELREQRKRLADKARRAVTEKNAAIQEVEKLHRKIETRNGTILKCASLLAELMQAKKENE